MEKTTQILGNVLSKKNEAYTLLLLREEIILKTGAIEK